MEYLHGKTHEHRHPSHEEAEHVHPHKHLHEQEHLDGHEQLQEHAHPHEHRGLTEIFQIIDQADMTSHAKELACKIFQIIGEAEAKAHGVSMDQVHFHEVGAIDSIVDVIAAAVCMDNLKIEEVIISQ